MPTPLRRGIFVALGICAVVPAALFARGSADRTPATASTPAASLDADLDAELGLLNASDEAVIARLQDWGLPVGRATKAKDPEALRAVCDWRELTGRPVHRQRLSAQERQAIVTGSRQPDFGVPDELRKAPVLINQVCQTMIYQERGKVVRILPISTGMYRGSSRNGLFSVYSAYTGGWQSSTQFPDPSGHPNMYKAMYFSGPLAIHGSNHPIKPFPESSGCTRTDPEDQDWLVKRLRIGSAVYSYGDWWVGRTQPFGIDA